MPCLAHKTAVINKRPAPSMAAHAASTRWEKRGYRGERQGQGRTVRDKQTRREKSVESDNQQSNHGMLHRQHNSKHIASTMAMLHAHGTLTQWLAMEDVAQAYIRRSHAESASGGVERAMLVPVLLPATAARGFPLPLISFLSMSSVGLSLRACGYGTRANAAGPGFQGAGLRRPEVQGQGWRQ